MKAAPLILSVAVAAILTGGIYMMVRPTEYTREELGKKLLQMAVRGIEKAPDGNSPLELQCSRNSEPVGSEPVIVVCSGTGSEGPFKATFMAATRLPEFSLACQGSGVGLLLTKFNGVPPRVSSQLGADFEQVFMMSPQITN
jgi:hypothetical protein